MFLTTAGGVYSPETRYFGSPFADVLLDAGQVLPRAREIATEMVESESIGICSQPKSVMGRYYFPGGSTSA